MSEFTQMTDFVSDDKLHAYLDGEVTDAQRQRIEALAARDENVRARLERLRALAATLKSAYPDPVSGDERFARIVKDGFRGRERARFTRAAPRDWRQSAVAAIALGAIMGGGGYWLGQSSATGDSMGSIITAKPGSDLFAALETTPSGAIARVAESQTVKPILSFQTANGDYCREVELDIANASSVGIACRRDDAWRWITLVAASAPPSTADGYATVGEGASVIIERTFKDLQSGDPLSPAEERAVMASGWERP